MSKLLVCFTGLILALNWGCTPDLHFTVRSGSMSPTYRPGEVVRAYRYSGQELKRFDVVVFTPPPDSLRWQGAPTNTVFMFRIIALPLETVWLSTNSVYVNDKPLYVPDIPSLSGSRTIPTMDTNRWQLRQNEFFVVGDNVTNALDSRMFGPISGSSIKAVVHQRSDAVSNRPMLPD